MNSRRDMLVLLAFGGLFAPIRSLAQTAARLPSVGILTLASPTPQIPEPIAAFLQAIRELGYIDGQTVRLEIRWAEGKSERLPELAVDLVRARVDLIVATGDAPIRAALGSTSTVPIVMTTSGDAVGAGFVASLARPGGRVTGMTSIAPELSAKRLQMVKELLPKASRVAVLWSPSDPVHAFNWAHMRAAERAIGVTLLSIELGSAADIDGALASLANTQADALVVYHNALIRAYRDRILEFVAKIKLPAMYEAAEYVDAGGLMAYGVTHADLFRRSASHVDKILKGAKPADIPVEQPTKVALVLNRRAAATLGIAIPPILLLRADRVVE